jgi:hypothetical protein
MSAALNYGLFAPLVDCEFEVRPHDPAAAPMPIRLIEVLLASHSPQHEQFSLLWESEAVLAQGTYRFRQAQAGEFDIFIVPIGRGAGATRYEAVFNLRRTEP